MLSNKKLARLLLLVIPLVALYSGCNSLPGNALLTGELTQPSLVETPDELKSGISMTLGDNGFSGINQPVEMQPKPEKSSVFGQPFSKRSEANEILNSARQLELAGKFPESIEKFEWLMRKGHESPMVLHRLAVLYDKTGQFERSTPYYQRAVELNPTNAELLCDIGFRSSVNGDNESAEKFLNLALENSPNLDRAHNNLAVVFARTNRPDLAWDHFLQAGCTQEEASHNLSIVANTQSGPSR